MQTLRYDATQRKCCSAYFPAAHGEMCKTEGTRGWTSSWLEEQLLV